MYYQTITIGTKPGVRLQGIALMKNYAAWAKEKYDVSTQVLGNARSLPGVFPGRTIKFQLKLYCPQYQSLRN